MSLLPCFQLSLVPSAQGMTGPGTAPPAELCLDLGIEPCDGPECSETPANSKKMGSFNWDREIGWAYEDSPCWGERSGKLAKPDAQARAAFPPFQPVPPALVTPAPPAPVPSLPACPSARIPSPLPPHACPSAPMPLPLPARRAAPGPPPP